VATKTFVPSARASFIFLALGLLAAAVYVFLPRTPQLAVYQGAGLAAASVIFYGVWRYRPRAWLPWSALGAGLLLWTSADGIWNSYEWLGKVAPYPSTADILYLLAYPLFAYALFGLLRRTARFRLGDLMDATVLVLLAAVLIFAFVVDQVLQANSQSLAGTVISTAYPVMDTVLLAVLVYFLFGAMSSPALRLLTVGFGLELIADLIYARQLAEGTYVGGGALDIGWIVFYGLVGAAALHPSMRRIRRKPVTRGPVDVPWLRLALLALAAFAVPAIVAVGANLETGLVSAALIGLVLFVRVGLLLRDQHRAEIALNESHEHAQHLAEQLRQAEKMEALGQLAGGVAHDFNNLLLVIRGSCELGQLSLADGDPAREDLDRAIAGIDQAADITGRLLAFSRKEVGKLEVVDLNDVVAESTRFFAPLLRGEIDLAVVAAPAPAFVQADRSQLGQVLTNLAVNSSDAMPQGGRLTIDVALEGGDAVIRVADTGEGMDENTAAHAFEPFFTTKTSSKGTGLGLATVHGVVTRLGGSIELETSPGEGAVFTIRLPCADGAPAPAIEPTRNETPELRSGRILVVEDDDPVRRIVTKILERSGFDVVAAADGKAALAAFGAEPDAVDLVVTDVIMPGISGRELAQRLTAYRPQLPVLYMSGYTGDLLEARNVMEDGADFIRKPFTGDDLVAKVSALLGSI
jgi:signal transduction histidine kinase/CheY-like chemotaxis protein